MTNNINNEKCRLFASIFVVVVVVDHSHHHYHLLRYRMNFQEHCRSRIYHYFEKKQSIKSVVLLEELAKIEK